MSNRPTHALFIVRDGKNKDGTINERDTRWQRLASLWPSKSGGGFSGMVSTCAPILVPSDGVRFVITDIKYEDTQDQGDGAHGADNSGIPF